MNLYLISQSDVLSYDTYDSAVVAAETEEEARLIHPGGLGRDFGGSDWTQPEHVSVRFLGPAVSDIQRGVVLASFNAG